ncbi:class II aldolase/adducin family protein [Amorphus sp. 3PC139-8]|uniref:class II aldolase/adducin family protein n=1 Tax=Amorphus sp. 3PC139-8 TaxID=2735676 RepID=UPI00345DE28F
MLEAPEALLADLVTAHRILVGEGVLDAFGHISVRDPRRSDRFWLSRATPPSRVVRADFVPLTLDGEPAADPGGPLFSERFIHAAVYAQRPDVFSVCHHHSPSVMPFCIADHPLVAVSQTGASIGAEVSRWDSRDEFGATAMLVNDMAQAMSLVRALGSNSLVLMRGHGATVTGSGLKELVFRAVHACRDADYQLAAAPLGHLQPLSSEEIEMATPPAVPAIERCWSHWTAALDGDGKSTERSSR